MTASGSATKFTPLHQARKIFRAVLITLGLGLLISATAAWRDKRVLSTLEHVCLPTGLGVDQYVALPEPLAFNKALGQFGGAPIFAASLNLRQIDGTDLEVLVSGRAGEPPVFRRYHAASAGEPEAEREYFLKVGPQDYLRVHQGSELADAPFASGKVGCVPRH